MLFCSPWETTAWATITRGYCTSPCTGSLGKALGAPGLQDQYSSSWGPVQRALITYVNLSSLFTLVEPAVLSTFVFLNRLNSFCCPHLFIFFKFKFNSFLSFLAVFSKSLLQWYGVRMAVKPAPAALYQPDATHWLHPTGARHPNKCVPWERQNL